MKKIVYVAHNIGGPNQKTNMERLTLVCRELNLRFSNLVPFVPYWMDLHALDDSNAMQRNRGIENDHEFFSRKTMDYLWVAGTELSNGVKAEINLAMQNRIPIIISPFEQQGDYNPEVFQVIMNDVYTSFTRLSLEDLQSTCDFGPMFANTVHFWSAVLPKVVCLFIPEP